ncbi:DNA mismatch repair protein Msh2 [Thraustotheca clavata]|uniref:DNA mismatch repair protein Msh2 n=1 Tax=Thraustotheca clavata TaxID=74557 RepID=A0A1W0A095_9STRA|nr:DNA mismatch repair protein Msh2 [Thraustotheca clavata]
MDTSREDLMEENQGLVLMAVQVRTRKNQNEVGVAVRRPRARNSCVRKAEGEDKKQCELLLYSFTDCNQLSTLDNLLVQIAPSECLVAEDNDVKPLRMLLQAHCIERRSVSKSSFKHVATTTEANICRLLGETSIMASHRTELEMDMALNALTSIIDTLSLMSDTEGYGSYTLAVGDMDSYLQLDRAALTALNLLPDPLLANSSITTQNGSILELLNRGKTAMGKRLLERWIRMPLVESSKIAERQDIVELFVDESTLRMELLDECMKAIPDLEKLALSLDKQKNVKLDYLVSVYDAAKFVLPRIHEAIHDHERLKESFTAPLHKVITDFTGYISLIEELVDMSTRPNVTVNAKHDPELLALRASMKDLEEEIEAEHDRVRNDISGDTKLEKDKVHGFVFRIIDKKQEERVSKIKDVHICQVLVNGFYFNTMNLKSLAKSHKEHTKEYEARQAHILQAAIEVAATYVPVIESSAKLIATLDVLLGFAHVASHASYTRPILGTSSISLQQARHPCVELQEGVEFIPNNVEMEAESRYQILTGPNMGGKSTYIRSLGAIAVMAQIGSFVPATSAMLPILDRLLVRVGAGDMQQRGVSTFMLEMLEAAVICKKATSKSLVIIDELGRGTSTYDGFGLAWAISEYLLQRKCWCVFATHFHELTALASSVKGIVNKHVTAHAVDDTIAMVYEVRDGPCLESFGIHVAEMAGFPKDVVAHAKRKARELEHFEMPNPNKKARNNPVEFRNKFVNLSIDSMSDSDVLAAVTKLLD